MPNSIHMPAQRILEREQRRLCDTGLIERRGCAFVPAEYHPSQIAADVRLQQLRAFIQRAPERGLLTVEVRRHAGMLGALAREKEGHGPDSHLNRRGYEGAAACEQFDRLFPVLAYVKPPVREAAPSNLKRVACIGQLHLGMSAKVLGQPRGGVAEGASALGRKDDQVLRPRRPRRLARGS